MLNSFNLIKEKREEVHNKLPSKLRDLFRAGDGVMFERLYKKKPKIEEGE